MVNSIHKALSKDFCWPQLKSFQVLATHLQYKSQPHITSVFLLSCMFFISGDSEREKKKDINRAHHLCDGEVVGGGFTS